MTARSINAGSDRHSALRYYGSVADSAWQRTARSIDLGSKANGAQPYASSVRHLRSGQRAASTWAAAANLGLVHVGEVEHDGELLQVEVGQLFPQPRHLLWR
eukprot:1545964-Rhodomonas_salina.2